MKNPRIRYRMVLLTAEIDMKLVLTLDKRRIRQSEVGSCERERERERFVMGLCLCWVCSAAHGLQRIWGQCEEHGWTFHIM